MNSISNLALASGLIWGSGLRLFATVFVVGIFTKFGYIHSPLMLAILSKPILISLAGVMRTIEFLADKISYVDRAWNGKQTLIRVQTKAILAMCDIKTVTP